MKESLKLLTNIYFKQSSCEKFSITMSSSLNDSTILVSYLKMKRIDLSHIIQILTKRRLFQLTTVARKNLLLSYSRETCTRINTTYS